MRYTVNKKTMAEAEKRAIERGETQEDLIRSVAKGIVSHPDFLRLLEDHAHKKPILLLIGKGLNGLDGLSLGCELLRGGYQVGACLLSERKNHPLSCLFFDEFSLLGGSLVHMDRIALKPWGLIIDGLLGLGAKHKKDKELADLIQIANSIKAPIISIDLPSGIDPETGEIWDGVISAEYTFACQAPKIGSFYQKAWEHVGTLCTVDIGLSDFIGDTSVIEIEDATQCLSTLERTTHKYRRGTVHLVAGSREMMGAASLAAHAAFSSGAGYVRSYIPSNAHEASLLLPLEAVRSFYDSPEWPSLASPEKGALVVGPGLGKSQNTEQLMQSLLTHTSLPVVIDGDGLGCLPKDCFKAQYLQNAILTPHRKEAERLFQIPCQELSQQVIDRLQEVAKELETTIILKGSPTVLFFPSGTSAFMGFGTPAMATAGSGDVLSGILGSLLSQGLPKKEATLLGTVLHAIAGREAALARTSYSVQASHLIEYLPKAFKKLLEYRGVTFQTYLPTRLRTS